MKVAHFVEFAPNACGLYHTAKDLIFAEQSVGIDARMIAYGSKYDGIKTDGSFKTEDIEWAYQTDILVRHSAIPTHLQCSGIPIVMAMHGRPESSVKLERQGVNPVITTFHNKTKDQRYKAFITFWPEYIDLWSNIIPKEKLFYVPPSVDLRAFNPDIKPYDHPKSKCDVLIIDMWREDVTPFNVIFAAAEFARKHQGKVHIVGLSEKFTPPVSRFLSGIKDVLGCVAGQMRDVGRFYTFADIVVTPHVIATRVVREALASGVPLVAGKGCKYTKYTANPMNIPEFARAIKKCWKDKSQQPRRIAGDNFNYHKTGTAIKKVFDKVLCKPESTQRKVFIDIGGHLGESVRRFYREIPDADEYEIYSFEPDSETFTRLDENVGHIGNVDLINACAGSVDGIIDFFVGQQNQNEGGTALKGKQTGGVDYRKPIKVESVDFARWFKVNVAKDDYVIVKVNIEGGEYDLMEVMLDNDLTGMIDKLFIQLHAHKFEHGKQRQSFHDTEALFWNTAKCKCFFKNKGCYPFYEE